MRPILAAIRTAPLPQRPRRADAQSSAQPVPPVNPFITISREAGVGAWSLAGRLARRLNERQPGNPPWTSFDRELVEKIAADRRIAPQLVESLEEESHSWLADFWTGLSFGGKKEIPTEVAVFRQIAAAIRALAQVGRVVIVGRGGAFITRDMPNGIHVRLTAPLDHRIDGLARREQLDRKIAALRVRQLDRNRLAFHRRYWPDHADDPAIFHLTLNTAALDIHALTHCIIPVVQHRSLTPDAPHAEGVCD